MAKMSSVKKWSVRTFVRAKLVLNRIFKESEDTNTIIRDYLAREYSTTKTLFVAGALYLELGLLIALGISIGTLIFIIFN